jgi:hypothetical protein
MAEATLRVTPSVFVDLLVQTENAMSSFTGLLPSLPLRMAAALLALCAVSAPALAQTGAAPAAALTPDQRAIVDSLAKSPHEDNVLTLKMPDGSIKEYAVAPTGLIGAKVRLPLRNGQYITLVRRETVIDKDGSVSWHGEVEETGERAVLMLWNNALLSGYVVYKGTILSIESLGGGIEAISEMDPLKLPPEHPPAAARDSAAITTPDEPATLRPAPPEPTVAPFPDAERQALEAKIITIDLMVLYTRNVTKHYIRDPEDLLTLAIDEINETFRNSGLGNISLRLVHSQLLDYDDSVGEQFNHLYGMVDESQRTIEEYVVELLEEGRHLGLLDAPPDDWQQPLLKGDGAVDLPGAALGGHCVRRDHEYDGASGLDQTAEPCFPVFADGDVMLVEVRLEASEL